MAGNGSAKQAKNDDLGKKERLGTPPLREPGSPADTEPQRWRITKVGAEDPGRSGTIPAETPSMTVTSAPSSTEGRSAGLSSAVLASGGAARAWRHTVSLALYLSRTEVHTYAFSVAANAILSLFPFIVMLFTVAREVLHSSAMTEMVGDMLRYFLPANQDFVVKNMYLLVHPRGRVQVISTVMLLVSSSGVFLPLEVALNQVWGVTKNRSYLFNQLLSLGLALAVGLMAVISVGIAAAQNKLLALLFFGHTNNFVFTFIGHTFLRLCAAVLSVAIFFLIYWALPNRKLPVRAVLPTAIVIGLLWDAAKVIYVKLLPWLDLRSAYGPFAVSVSLMIWAFVTGLLLLAGAHSSATRFALRVTQEAEQKSDAE
jgi:membrane protein